MELRERRGDRHRKSLPPYNRKMAVLRFLAQTILAVWVGGLAVLAGITAPVIFRALEDRDPIAGRELAGFVFGEVFRSFLSASIVCGALLIVLLGIRAALGPRPRRIGVRLWTVMGMIALSAVTLMVLVPRIDGIRRAVRGPIASLAVADPRRIEFGRLHALSNGLMLVTLLGGLGLVWFEAQDTY
jgi:hypothetical protein